MIQPRHHRPRLAALLGVCAIAATFPASALAFNPQPEPPGRAQTAHRGATLVALNPQPEPPG